MPFAQLFTPRVAQVSIMIDNSWKSLRGPLSPDTAITFANHISPAGDLLETLTEA